MSTAVGPGCPDLTVSGNGSVVYNLNNGMLDAEATCFNGYRFAGTDLISKTLQCLGSLWNDTLTPCIGENTYFIYINYTFNSFSATNPKCTNKTTITIEMHSKVLQIFPKCDTKVTLFAFVETNFQKCSWISLWELL